MPRAGVAAASLTHLAAQAQPRHRPVFSDLVGIADAAQSVELLLITRVAFADQGDGGAELERANIDDAEAEAVARARKARRRARFPDAEQRQSSKAVRPNLLSVAPGHTGRMRPTVVCGQCVVFLPHTRRKLRQV